MMKWNHRLRNVSIGLESHWSTLYGKSMSSKNIFQGKNGAIPKQLQGESGVSGESGDYDKESHSSSLRKETTTILPGKHQSIQD